MQQLRNYKCYLYYINVWHTRMWKYTIIRVNQPTAAVEVGQPGRAFFLSLPLFEPIVEIPASLRALLIATRRKHDRNAPSDREGFLGSVTRLRALAGNAAKEIEATIWSHCFLFRLLCPVKGGRPAWSRDQFLSIRAKSGAVKQCSSVPRPD